MAQHPLLRGEEVWGRGQAGGSCSRCPVSLPPPPSPSSVPDFGNVSFCLFQVHFFLRVSTDSSLIRTRLLVRACLGFCYGDTYARIVMTTRCSTSRFLPLAIPSPTLLQSVPFCLHSATSLCHGKGHALTGVLRCFPSQVKRNQPQQYERSATWRASPLLQFGLNPGAWAMLSECGLMDVRAPSSSRLTPYQVSFPAERQSLLQHL